MPPALRHRPHQKTRPRRRPDHAQPRKKPAPRPRLPQNDRQRLPAKSTRLTLPPAPSLASPSTLGKPGSPCHARFPAIHLNSAAILSNQPAPPQKSSPLCPITTPSNDMDLQCQPPTPVAKCLFSATRLKIRTNLPWDTSQDRFTLVGRVSRRRNPTSYRHVGLRFANPTYPWLGVKWLRDTSHREG